MARNQEKAQSMLYRFRQAQAIEMGLETAPAKRRPRMASSVSSLKECEKWRGEILREISRKVSKIQDAGLTDYAVRDLNDEINKLMREKTHWERQIVALGGANYHRARSAMVDDQGQEVPGTRGYKYFGRAKDLPGVKELFQKGPATQENAEAARANAYQKFRNQGPDYYGDADEMDEDLVREEQAMEEQDWQAAFEQVIETLGLPEDTPAPSVPKPKQLSQSASFSYPQAQSSSLKRKQAANGTQPAGSNIATGEEVADDAPKRGKPSRPAPPTTPLETVDPAAFAHITGFMGILDAESLQTVEQPTKDQMHQILLDARKKALLAEYGV